MHDGFHVVAQVTARAGIQREGDHLFPDSLARELGGINRLRS